MDPNQCLKELLELNEKVGDFADSYSSDELSEVPEGELEDFLANVNDLCDHVSSIHGWMISGGFLPERWSTNRKKTKATK